MKPLATADIGGVVYRVYRHPELLMCDNITEWIKDYSYTRDMGVQVRREDRHPCWLEAYEFWETCIKGVVK